MPSEGQSLDKVVDQIRQETGARMIVLGEKHNQQNTIQYIRDSLPDLKTKGVSTLYLELPSNIQPMMDKALQGDEKAQRDLRMRYEQWFGSYGGPEGAQQRYDMLFEANKAGIRVKCSDVDELNESMQRYNTMDNEKPDGQSDMASRMIIGNHTLAKNIKEMDDGKAAIFIVGANHTFRAGAEEHIEEINNEKLSVYNSVAGGVDEQLRERGIPTASVDFTNRQGNTEFKLEKSENNKSNDYLLHATYEDDSTRTPQNSSCTYRVKWDRLANIFEQAGINAEVSGDKAGAQMYAKAAKEMGTLPRLLDDPNYVKLSTNDAVKVLSDAMERVSVAVRPAEERLTDPIHKKGAEQLHTDTLFAKGEKDTPDGQQAVRNVVNDNEDLNLKGAEKMWKRPGAPLAGEATGLKKEWAAAQVATEPLDNPKAKPEIDPALRQNAPPPRPTAQSFSYS